MYRLPKLASVLLTRELIAEALPLTQVAYALSGH